MTKKMYAFLFKYHPTTGVLLNDILGQSFGNPQAFDQSETHALIGHKMAATAITANPLVAAYIDPNLPDFITSRCANPLDASLKEMSNVVETYGNPGEAWTKVINNFQDTL